MLRRLRLIVITDKPSRNAIILLLEIIVSGAIAKELVQGASGVALMQGASDQAPLS